MTRLTLFRTLTGGCSCLAMAIVIGCRNSDDQSTRADALPIDDVEIPSQEEADARAAQDISPENADEAFRQLEREILAEDDLP